MKFPRVSPNVILLVLALAMSLQSFRFFPGNYEVTNIWIAIGVLYMVGPYLLGRICVGLSIPAFELYVISLMVVMPFFASLAALNAFSQPLYYGIGNQRSAVLCAGALALIHSYRRGVIGIAHIERSFIYLAWGSLCIYTAMTLLVDPSRMSDEYRLVRGGIVEEARFNFNSVFVIFGFIYYIMAGYLRMNARMYWHALPFFVYILVIDGGRALLLAMLLAAGISVFRYGSIKRIMLLGIWVSAAIISMAIYFYNFNAEFLSARIDKFSAAFIVMSSGEISSDVSANQRIFETRTAIPHISEHWLIGSGRVSSQWNGGYTGVIGSYFYPGDIGLIGALFIYGILGCMIYSLQFYFAWRFSKNVHVDHPQFIFFASVLGYLLYFAIHSLVAGLFVHYPEVGIIMVAVLYIASHSARSINMSPMPDSYGRK